MALDNGEWVDISRQVAEIRSWDISIGGGVMLGVFLLLLSLIIGFIYADDEYRSSHEDDSYAGEILFGIISIILAGLLASGITFAAMKRPQSVADAIERSYGISELKNKDAGIMGMRDLDYGRGNVPVDGQSITYRRDGVTHTGILDVHGDKVRIRESDSTVLKPLTVRGRGTASAS